MIHRGRCSWGLLLVTLAALALPRCRCGVRRERPPAGEAPAPPRRVPRAVSRAAPPPAAAVPDVAPARRDAAVSPPSAAAAGPAGAPPRAPGAPDAALGGLGGSASRPAAGPGLRRRGAAVDIDVHRVEVRWLLQRLATLTETNLVLFDDVQGTVTVQMSRVPPGAALERVARAVGLVVERSGSMVLVRAARSPE